MKVSKLALVMALMAGLGMSAPSAAQRAKKGAAAAATAGQWAPKMGKEFRNAAAGLQTAIQAKDFATAKTLVPAAETAALTPDEKFVLAQFKLQIATGENNLPGQQAAVDQMLATNTGPAELKPQLLYYQGQFAYNSGNFPAAIQSLTAAQQAGYVAKDATGQPSQQVNLLIAESHFKANQTPQGLSAIEQAIEAERKAGKKPPAEWYGRAASQAYRAKLMPEVAKWTRLQVSDYPTPENWRSALVIFGDANRLDDQTQLDLFRLQRAAGALAGERDYFDYALLADKVGLPGEAKAVVDEGRAKSAYNSGSKAIAEITAAVTPKIAGDRAALTKADASRASSTGRTAMADGDAYFGYGDYAKAASLYQLAIQKGGVDATTAQLRLGTALARAGQVDQAKQAFGQVTQGPRAAIAQYWTLWLSQAGARAS